MKKFLVNNTVQKGLLQSDMVKMTDNVLEGISALTYNVHFAILSGLEWQDNAYTAGVVIMDGVIRTVPAGATTTSYLAPYDEPTDSRLTQNGTPEATYINYTTTISSSDTGYPPLTWENVKAYGGWIGQQLFSGGSVFRWYRPIFGSLSIQKTSSGVKINFTQSENCFKSISQNFDSRSNNLTITFSGASNYIINGGLFIIPNQHVVYRAAPIAFAGGVQTYTGYPDNTNVFAQIDVSSMVANDVVYFSVLLIASPYGEVPSYQLQSNG